jgi:hypothetical protein
VAKKASTLKFPISAGWQKLLPEIAESKFLMRLYLPEGKPKVTGFEFDSGSGPFWRQEPRFSWQRHTLAPRA